MQYIDVYIQHKYLPFLCVQILAIPWNRVVKQLLLIRVLKYKMGIKKWPNITLRCI